jgi:O-antigen/teichoic acid export membrane protein
MNGGRTPRVDEPASQPSLEDPSAISIFVFKRAAQASTALVIRQGLVYGTNILGSVVLARLLPPDQFGFYGIVLFAVAFLGIFGGTGFAANLIRTRDEPSLEDMRVLFTAQQLMVGVLFLVLWIAAPALSSLYRMPDYGRWFFRMIGGALAMTSFMVMPQIRMERELAFDRLAIVEVCQAIAFNLSAVFLAWRGWGALSFSAALMIRAGIGAILAHRSMPWKMGLMWHPPTLFRHLHFGAAVQAGQFVAMLKDSISPLFVGMFLGTADVGYVTWASSLSAYALWILMPMQRLYMPFFARLQHDREQLRRVVSFALWMANLVAAPLTIITLALSRPITVLIFGQKWLVALPLYYLFCFGTLLVPSSTPLMGVLNALGQSKKTLAMSVIWMGTTWLFGVPCILLFGLNGFGVAMIGVQLTNLVLFWMVWRTLAVSPLAAYWPSWPLAAGVGLLLFLAQFAFPIHNLLLLSCYVTAGIVVYGTVLWFAYPQKILNVVRLLRSPA